MHVFSLLNRLRLLAAMGEEAHEQLNEMRKPGKRIHVELLKQSAAAFSKLTFYSAMLGS